MSVLTQAPIPKNASTHGVTYRPASDADLHFLAELYASTRAEEVASTGWPAEQQRSFLQSQFAAQHDHYKKHYPDAQWLVIRCNDTDAGRLYIEDWSRELRIIDIALMPAWRGQGIGAAILQDLMDRSAATGRAVSIHVEKNNEAMSLYKRLGFQKIEDKGVYDLMEWHPTRPAG